MIKIKYHREFTGTIKSCTISKTPTNKYFISILADTENKTGLMSIFWTQKVKLFMLHF